MSTPTDPAATLADVNEIVTRYSARPWMNHIEAAQLVFELRDALGLAGNAASPASDETSNGREHR
jgi:hypothetical protein